MAKIDYKKFKETLTFYVHDGSLHLCSKPSETAQIILALGFVQEMMRCCEMARMKVCGFTIVWNNFYGAKTAKLYITRNSLYD